MVGLKMTFCLGVLLTPYFKIEFHLRLLFVISSFNLDELVVERLLMELRSNTLTLVFPSGYIHIVGIVTLGLTFLGLAFGTEVSAARLVTVESVSCHKLADLEEIFKTQGLLKFLIELELSTRYIYIAVELFLESLDFLESLLETLLVTSHTYILPHNVAKLLVKRINGLLTLDRKESVDTRLYSLLSLLKLRGINVSLRL